MLIVLDGLRWQEVFDGPDAALKDKDHGGVEELTAPGILVSNLERLTAKF